MIRRAHARTVHTTTGTVLLLYCCTPSYEQDVERIGDVLSSLDKVGVTLPILRESKVGATVSKLKKHANEGVSSSAKALVKKWKKVAEASQEGGPGNAAAAAATPGKSEKPSSSGKGRLHCSHEIDSYFFMPEQ